MWNSITGRRGPASSLLLRESGSAASWKRLPSIWSQVASDVFLRDKSLRTGILSGVGCLLALLVLYGLFVDRFHFGISSGPFLMSTSFGMPEATARAGVLPFYDHPVVGWDGQFYYHQSNDPLLLGDGPKYCDNPSYRYQRNLVPLLAFVSSRAAGYSVTPPEWFQTIQLGFTALGFGVLAWLLCEHGLSPWLTMIWMLSGGLIWSLFRGLPDAPADALFIVAIAALYRGGLITYVLAASMLLLCREGYAIFAAAVFALTCLRHTQWQTKWSLPMQALSCALPGVIALTWAWYIAERLDLPFLHGSKTVPFGGLVDWPLFSAFRMLKKAFDDHSKYELIYKSVTIATLLVVGAITVQCWRKSLIFAASIPYLVLVAMTGDIVWGDACGYLKASSSVLVIGTLLLKYSSSDLLKTVLVLNLLIGIHCGYKKNYSQVDKNFTPIAVNPQDLVKPLLHSPPLQPGSPLMSEGLCRLQCRPVETKHVAAASLFSFAPRRLWLYEVEAKNEGTQSWIASTPGIGCICLDVELRNSDGKVVYDSRRSLHKTIAAGEVARFLAAVPVPTQAGEYQLRIGMLQEGHNRLSSPATATDYVATVRTP